MDPSEVTITKEQLRTAIVAGWLGCIPRYHMELDRTWEALQTGYIPKGTEEPRFEGTDEAYMYALNSRECWGDEHE